MLTSWLTLGRENEASLDDESWGCVKGLGFKEELGHEDRG